MPHSVINGMFRAHSNLHILHRWLEFAQSFLNTGMCTSTQERELSLVHKMYSIVILCQSWMLPKNGCNAKAITVYIQNVQNVNTFMYSQATFLMDVYTRHARPDPVEHTIL